MMNQQSDDFARLTVFDGTFKLSPPGQEPRKNNHFKRVILWG